MSSLTTRVKQATAWVGSNPVLGILLIVSSLMTAGTAIGSTVSVILGLQQQASALANIAAAFGTLLLVGITGSYAISTQQMVRESRIERFQPHITSLISQGIDELLEELSRDREGLDKTEFKGDTPEFCNLRKGRHNEGILTDLRTQNREVMELWDNYQQIKAKYLDKRENAQQELTDVIKNEFLERFESHSYSDFLPEGYEEEDLRSGMVSSNPEIQDLMQGYPARLADFVLRDPESVSNNERNYGDGTDFVGENDILYSVYTTYHDELIEYRNRNSIAGSLNELQDLNKDLSYSLSTTKAEIEEFRHRLKSEYDVSEMRIRDSDAS